MWRTIKKGKHNNFSIPSIHFGKASESYEVMFDESCRYDLQGVDQLDWNKLFGWSYGLHHKNSSRVGWRYNKSTDKIEVCMYQYYNSNRIIGSEISVAINQKVFISLYPNLIIVNPDLKEDRNSPLIKASYGKWVRPTWGYNLDLWFGGSKKAPHDIRVWLKKV